jgi:hypothetical protein
MLGIHAESDLVSQAFVNVWQWRNAFANHKAGTEKSAGPDRRVKANFKRSVRTEVISNQPTIPACSLWFGWMKRGKTVKPRTPLDTLNTPEFPWPCCWFNLKIPQTVDLENGAR